MTNPRTPTTVDTLFSTLHERAKELNCLYRIEEILSIYDVPLEEVFRQVIEALPPGWQYPECCQAQITYGTDVYETPDYEETPYVHCAEIRVQDAAVGRLCVSYKKPTPESDCGPFMKGEIKLIHSIAERLGHFILHQRLRGMYEQISDQRREAGGGRRSWRIALDLLRNTNPTLLLRVSRKMMNYLGWRGVPEARDLLQRFSGAGVADGLFGESNLPQTRESLDRFVQLTEETFRIASANLTDDEVFDRIQKWINEDRSRESVRALENVYAGLPEVLDSMRRVKILAPEGIELPRSLANSVRVALIRRFFTEQLEFINVAKKYVDIEDFFDLSEKIVFPPGSHGKLGGKSAGLFLAGRVLAQAARRTKAIGTVKRPKTWYVTSDGLIAFTSYNNLDDVHEQKYKDIEIVRQEYPHLVQVFKNSTFPPEIVKGLSVALDDFGDVPLIVRSSSLLEDRLGTAFAGKYKSLFLANQGDKQQRLEALLDAVAEVYASIFSPDPIQYRAERGLLDFYEEMGIMIQEVVGTRVGKYFFPAYAGVAFSRNEFRWSPRVRREDGLLRLVPGLGTRAVDRVSDDYPVLVSPGQPNLRVNVSTDEVVRYSPKRIDVIDLEENTFMTRDLSEVLREVGRDFPALTKVFSVYKDGLLQRPMGLATDWTSSEAVATFDGLISASPFMPQLEAILKTLSAAMGVPVDIEFASTGTEFYLLQCRAQSQAAEDVAMEIPANLPDEAVLFTALKHVPNGRVADITHIVYVDPDRYGDLASFADLVAVGQAVGKLNKLLPRRQFILMGPGRWGSRGDIKLGVRVTYSEINNSAMLIEVARKKGNYVPDVSFGTHFFQDLVESGIRYLPLYPDDEGVRFNQKFLDAAPNRLAEHCPECAGLADALRVIDVPEATGGRVLRVVMNADQGAAVGYFAPPEAVVRTAGAGAAAVGRGDEDPQRWRLRMAERLAYHCGTQKWEVRGVYYVEPSDGDEADPASPLRLVIHVLGGARQRKELETWLQGWSLSLAEMNYFRTGFHSDGLLDVRFLTDERVHGEKDVAARINALSNAVHELPLRPRIP
ncbi:MAG TPA: PEP/pyruvate-binding domain-containing protein [Candidatus Aminicenantes bacterium]|nr:PEP/pyruvate-binding domain-containing protein [Candidatus Aminicenantes bacterium]HRY63719.1 PEP/pyruvate-binding domain-containing protein [Candidatus Aminicenantes bacterium]HRZ70632.1 PEP/pyruvate-binding domain-containing protein [Candidatus Aminicenantes bacterium]